MKWLTVKYQGTQQTGPAKAIQSVCEDLEDKDIDYSVEDFPAVGADEDAPVEGEDNGLHPTK